MFGIAAQIHYGNDEYFARTDLVNQAKWKAVCPAPPGAGGKLTPRFRVGKNAFYRGFNFVQELYSKSIFRLIIIESGLTQLA